ncbi:hypothetical protein V6N13_029457 [Hibiscus sabdariffa]
MVDLASDSSLVSSHGDLNLLNFSPLGVAPDDAGKVVSTMVAAAKEAVTVGSVVVGANVVSVVDVDVAEVAMVAPDSEKGISYVASAVGKLLYSDRAIVLKQQLKFAKVCVEVGAKDEIPDSILVDLGNENVKGIRAVGGVILKEDGSIVPRCIDLVVQDEPGQVARECVVQDCGAQEVSSSKVVNGLVSAQKVSDSEASGSSVVVGSANKFAALDDGSGNLGYDVVVDDSKKCRAAASGVVELMQQLKTKGERAEKER